MQVDRIALYNFAIPHKLEKLLNDVTPEMLTFADLPEYPGDSSDVRELPDRLKRAYAVMRRLKQEKSQNNVPMQIARQKENLYDLAMALFKGDLEEWLGEEWERGPLNVYRGGVIGKSRCIEK